MAGGLSGSGHSKAGAVVKQQLAAIRAGCSEGKSRSNQDLILLLENYNDQTELVIEALKTGETDGILGGWAVTSKKGKGATKNKKISESDFGQDNTSETSNNKPRAQPVALAPVSSLKADSKPKLSVGGAPPNAGRKQEPVINKKVSKHTDNEAAVVTPPQVLTPKEVPIPDIHSHAASLNRLLIQVSETHVDDLKNLDFAFEQVRRLVEHRYETLRRNLERSDEQTVRVVLQIRRQQGSDLSDVVAQASAMSPKEYADWQQDVTKFTTDYKYDTHLANSGLFSYSVEELQKEVNKFGNVTAIIPSYSYKPIELKVSQPEKPTPIAHSPAVTSKPRPAAAINNQQSSAQRIEAPTQRQNSTGSRNTNTDTRKEKVLQSERSVQESARSHEKLPESRERVTIVPKDIKGVAPMESLVISGGNLTAEELSKLTLSLQNSLQFPTQPRNDPPKISQNGGFGSGDFAEQDIFSGGAIWTNSNATFVADTWNPNPDHQAGFSVSSESFPRPSPTQNGGAAPFRGGPGHRGTRRAGARGYQNGRGGRPYRGKHFEGKAAGI